MAQQAIGLVPIMRPSECVLDDLPSTPNPASLFDRFHSPGGSASVDDKSPNLTSFPLTKILEDDVCGANP
jgi:hypothetical protein